MSEIKHGPKLLAEGEFGKWLDATRRFFDRVKLFPVMSEAHADESEDFSDLRLQLTVKSLNASECLSK